MDGNKLFYNQGTHQLQQQANLQMQGIVRNPKPSNANNVADAQNTDGYTNQEKVFKTASQPPPLNFTTVTAATGNLIVANNSRGLEKPQIQVVQQNVAKAPIQNKYASQNHHTLQCLSDINEFKQKVNMVLQSQAFPGNQANIQKINMPNNQRIEEYNSNQNQMSYNPGQRMPKLVVSSENQAGGYLSGHHANTQQVNKKLHITEDMTTDQNGENLTSAFLSFKNSLKDQNQIPQSHHFLRSSKESNRNLYQHLKNATTQQTDKSAAVPEEPVNLQQSLKELHPQSQPTSALNQQKKQFVNGNQMYSNSYVQNNQKQQQRRKLLFEYGLEKKLQSQSINANTSNSNTNRLKKSQTFKPGNEDPSEEGDLNNNESSKDAISQKDERERSSFDLLENLKHLNIEALDEKEREQLRFLSLQYQFHLQQYEESQKAELLKKEKQQNDLKVKSPKGSIGLGQQSFSKQVNQKEPNSAIPQTNNDERIIMGDSDYNSNTYSNGKHGGHLKNNKSVTKRSDLYQSQEQFIQNEKNLSEDRLKKKDNGRDSSIVNISGIELKQTPQSEQQVNNQSTKRGEIANQADQDPNRNDKLENINDHQGSQNLKRIASQNNVDRKKEPGWFLKMNQHQESKSFFQSENLNQYQQNSTGMNSQAIHNLQHFIENLGGNNNKTSVFQIQQQLKIQQDSSTTGSSQHQQMMIQRSNEVTQLYNKYNKVYRQADPKQQNLVQAKKESIHCPKPTPTQITQMSSPAQRLNLFKILQAREHIKFQNIQNEKMHQLQTLQEDQEFRQNLGQEEPKRFLDFVQRKGATNSKKSVFTVNQFQSKQLQNLQNIQQLKAMQKQQLNDQKAFGIFQMNELAQFRSMGESNQKQILLNNLQQGKFEEIEPFQPPQHEPPKTPATNKLQALQNNQHLNYGGSHKVEALQQKDFAMNEKEKFNLEKTIDINTNQLGPQMKKTVSDGNSSQNNFNNQVGSPKDQYGQTKTDQQKQQEFDSRQQNFSQVKNYSEMGINIFQSSRGNPPQGSGPKSVQQLHALGQSTHPSSMSNGNPNQQQLHVIRNPILNPVQIRYEESKLQFEACLRENIMKQQAERMQEISHLAPQQLGAKTRFSSQTKNMNLDNILPGFPQRIVNGEQDPKYEDKYRTRVKARTGASLSNTNKDNQKKLRLNGAKDEDGATTVPESTKSAAKKVGEKDDKDKKEDGEEKDKDKDGKEGELAPIEEVKKVPRYFPPRKMPNPFTEAANEQERFIQARKDALAKYSNISKNRFKQDESAPLKFVIKPGNNSKMITRVIEKSGRMEPKANGHPGWEAADDHMDSLYNYKWKPTSGGLKYDLIGKHGLKQVINHVKGHGNLTTKDNLFINMKAYCESQKQNIFDTVPLTIVLDYLKEDVGDKVEMFLALHKIIAKNKDNDFEVINQKMHEVQIQKEKSVKTPYKITDCCHKGQNLWLLKPTMLNRGIGIHIFQTFDELREIMCNSYGIGRGKRDKASIFNTHNHNHLPRGQPTDENGDKKDMIKSFTFVIQKLIEKPMLYHNRKFDLRTWCILNSADGKIYVYNECYVRTSSSEYLDYDPNTPNEDQIFMQLTNNAVQNTGADYGKFEEGNIISSDTLFAYIAQQSQAKGRSKKELETKFKADQDAIITNTIKSVKGKILMQKNTFELLGYDFILDEDLNTILIEVNTNPCLEESNNLLKHLIPRMIDDCLNITMDPVFANGAQTDGYSNKVMDRYKSVFPLPGDVFVIDQKVKPTGDDMHPGYKEDVNLFNHIYTMEVQQQ